GSAWARRRHPVCCLERNSGPRRRPELTRADLNSNRRSRVVAARFQLAREKTGSWKLAATSNAKPRRPRGWGTGKGPGPSQPRRREDLLAVMEEFTAHAVHRARRVGYDLVHAHFFTSALVATELKRLLGIPFVVSFHGLGCVSRLHGAEDVPDKRLAVEARA